jgi:hypothetical protein
VKVKVTIATEADEVLDQFFLIRTFFPEDASVKLANDVRNLLEAEGLDTEDIE